MADYDFQYQDTYIDALLATANELKTAGYIYKGVATPSTNPGTPTERVAYLASEPGTYTNFGGIVIASGLYSLTYASGAWTATQMQAGSDIEVVQTKGQSESNVMSQKAVTDALDAIPDVHCEQYGRYSNSIFVQGYANRGGSTTVTIDTLSTRIRTFIIGGTFHLKLKAGYDIRGVVTYNGGQLNGHPTGNFTASSVTSETISNPKEYIKTNITRRCTIVTICKEDATADILPTEDCIESFDWGEYDKGEIPALEQKVGLEKLNVTYKQGFTNTDGNSYIEYGSLATRVVTSIIKGNFHIRLKKGYRIRGITAWAGGQTSGEILANFYFSQGKAIVGSSLGLTEYYKYNSLYPYAAVTICKDNASANILPTEDFIDIIESIPTLKSIKKAVFMGDSITHGVYSYFNGGVQTDANRYNGFDISDLTSVVEATNSLNIPFFFGKYADCECVNLAKRGSGYVQDGRNIGNALEVATNYDFTDVDFVGLCFGINDYINAKPIGDISTSNTVIGNMVAVITKILTDNPLCKVIVYSPYNAWGQVSKGGDYVANELYGDASTNYALGYNKGGGTLQDYVDAEAEVCDYLGIQHVALSKSNVTNRISLKNVMIDGLHPSIKSWSKLAAEIFGKANFGD